MKPETMDKTKLSTMLQIGTVDTGSGTLFGVTKKRAVAKQTLTLVISTGGSGMSAIKQAIQTAKQKLDADYTQFVKFLVIDSDSGALAPLQNQGFDVQNFSTPGSVARLAPAMRDTFYKYFIPWDFPFTSLNPYGSGQERLIGKVKLYDENRNGSTNDQALRDQIAGYFNGDWAEHRHLPVDILLLTGISGGNGSGTFLDIAAIAKKACQDCGIAAASVTVYSYIMLPDTAEGFAKGKVAKDNFYRNGFAALKELESYESFFMEPGRKEKFYSTIAAHDIELTAASPLIDYPVLISGDYQEAVSLIAETIVNSIADHAADNGDVFTTKFFYSSPHWTRVSRLAVAAVSDNGVLKQGACPEDSHMYEGIGYAKAEIPERIVLPYVVSAASDKLYTPQANAALAAALQAGVPATAFCTSDHALDQADYERELRYLLGLNQNVKLEKENLWRVMVSPKLRELSRVRENTVEITRKDIVAGDVEPFYAGFAAVATYTQATAPLQKFLRDLYETLLAKCKVIMTKYGPRAIACLYDGTGNLDANGKKEIYGNGLREQIQYVSDQLLDMKGGKRPPRLKARNLVDAALHQYEVTEWCGRAKNATEQDVRFRLADLMKGDRGIWKTEFVDKVEDFLASTERFADVMEAISAYYAGVGTSLAANDFTKFAEAGSARNSVNLCKDANVYEWVKLKIDQKLATVDIGKVRMALVDDFYNHTDQWISSEEGVARQRFDEVMSASLQIGGHAVGGNGMSLEISDYFDYVLSGIAGAPAQATAVQNAVQDIYTQLITKSSPSLKLKPGTAQVINRYILLPESLKGGKCGPLIQKAFAKLVNGAAAGAEKGVYFSSVTDAIVCYQTSVANAISDLSDLDLWEDAYDAAHTNTRHLHNGEYPRLHMTTGFSQYNELNQAETDQAAGQNGPREVLPLDEAPAAADQKAIYGTGLSWFDYPSINYARYADDFTNGADTTESRYRSGLFAKRVKEALRIGIIECEKAGFQYKYFLNLLPKDWTNLEVNGYKAKNGWRFARGQKLFLYLKAQNPAAAGICRKQICLSDSPFFGPDGFNFTAKANLAHWTEDQADRQAELYMMRILRKATELYQEMEDTMYRFYPVEYALEEKEKEKKAQYEKEEKEKKAQYENFADWVLHGVITCDENGTHWSVRTTPDEVKLMTFSPKDVALMDKDQKRLLEDGLRLKLVYDSFTALRQEKRLTDDKMANIKVAVIKALSDEQFDQMLAKNIAFVQQELDKYNEKYGNTKDPLAAIMKAYEADNSQLDRMQEIVDFYTAVDNVVKV